ncbi:MAG: PhoH family protein, partial [Acidobacteriota bacterium]
PADARKVFVLDTSVILYDHLALNSFEEHDVAIPMTVLEELDRFKKGSAVINRNAREFIRRLDDYSGDRILQDWIPLDGGSSGRVRVVMPPQKDDLRADLAGLATAENDHKILASAMGLIRAEPDRRVVLVSKDINLRLKARALEMPAEDYKRVSIRDIDDLYRGKSVLEVDDPSIIDTLHRDGAVDWRDVLEDEPEPNHFFILQNVQRSGLAWYNPRERQLERIIKHQAYGVDPRNAEQTFALHAILDPNIPLVTLAGAAGTGKTLIALAGALERSRDFRRILLARPIVPLSNRDIGFLPGDVNSKIDPYMQPLWDNLGFIKSQFDAGERSHRRLDEMVEKEKLQITPLAYIRGRSFSRILFIIDEAQNLTPHEVKTIITRAGEGTKIVLTGDVFQIDTPYLDAHSNGLSYLIDRMRGQDLYAHVTLEKGERSVLANMASELL